jgi:basic membrane protein A and related proteins
MKQSRTTSLRLAVSGAVFSAAIAGCSIFSSQPGPTPSSTPASSSSTDISTETATPSPAQQFVQAVVVVAAPGEPKDWTAAGLTWQGVQSAAAQIGSTATLVEPNSNTDYAADLDRAAGGTRVVVVTVGPDADAAVQAAARDHPDAQFLEVDVAPADTAPANVHGLVFDEAEAGYLGGYVAAAFAGNDKLGMVGDTKTDARSANYAAGLAAGVAQAGSNPKVTLAYAGNAAIPDKGRTAAAGLVAAGDAVIVAMPSLAGIGAMRQACSQKARLVAADLDAWQVVPDVRPCLIVSVMKRYDVAVVAPIVAIASGKTLARLSMNDVANGGIGLSDFHADLPSGLAAKLVALIGALKGLPSPSPGA